jgi:CHAT domain-containing protein
MIDEFDPLTVRFFPDGPHRYSVRVTAGDREARGVFDLPRAEEQLDETISMLAQPAIRRFESPKSALARDLGQDLFDALFQGSVRDVYIRALDAAAGRGLRVTLCLSEAPELMRIPWEYMFHEQHYLALSRTPVVRYLDLPSPPKTLAVQGPLRVLGMVSNPQTTTALDAASERAHIEQALEQLKARGLAEIDWIEPPTLRQLEHRLGEREYHVLHLICHGAFVDEARGGVLAFETDEGAEDAVSGDRLGDILYGHDSLRLVVLNACEGAQSDREDQFAGVASAIVQREIPAVIAMQFEITDRAATLFAGELYAALADGRPVDAALVEARRAIYAARESVEFATPVLFMRTQNGRLFDLTPAQTAPVIEQRPVSDEPPARILDTPPRAVPVGRRTARSVALFAALALVAGLTVPAALHAASPDRFPTGSPYYGAFGSIPGHLPDLFTELAPALVVLLLLLAVPRFRRPNSAYVAYGLLAGAGASGVLLFGEPTAQLTTKTGATISWWDGLLVAASLVAAFAGGSALPDARRSDRRWRAATLVVSAAALASLIAATALTFNGFEDRKVVTDTAWNLLPTVGIPLVAAAIAALALAGFVRPVVAAAAVLALGICAVGVWLRFVGVPIAMQTSESSSNFPDAGAGAGAWLGLVASATILASGASRLGRARD